MGMVEVSGYASLPAPCPATWKQHVQRHQRMWASKHGHVSTTVSSAPRQHLCSSQHKAVQAGLGATQGSECALTRGSGRAHTQSRPCFSSIAYVTTHARGLPAMPPCSVGRRWEWEHGHESEHECASMNSVQAAQHEGGRLTPEFTLCWACLLPKSTSMSKHPRTWGMRSHLPPPENSHLCRSQQLQQGSEEWAGETPGHDMVQSSRHKQHPLCPLLSPVVATF